MRRLWLLGFALLATSPVLSQDPDFVLLSDDVVIEYDSAGEGSGSVSFYWQELDTTPGFPHTVPGWSLGITTNPLLVRPTNVEQGEYIASLNGGGGPDLWLTDEYDEGFTIGTVYGFLGMTSCTYEVPKEIAVVTYETNPELLVDDDDGAELAFEFIPLGDPPVSSVIIVAGQSLPVTLGTGTLTLVPRIETFLRGDCNLDGVADLADPIFLGFSLFSGGGPVGCDDACDANDDGVVNIADVVYTPSHLFGGGPPPPAPFPECGTDPTDDPLGCEMICP